ncbi:MAG: dUTP diphosphatase [Pseudomonadota bacterium]
MILPIRRLPNHDPELALPAYESTGAAGMDLRACLAPADRATGLKLPSLGRVLVPTGLAIAVPQGQEAQVRPRSGLAARQGITVLNSPGTIDADYRGEIAIILINLGSETALIQHGDRVAQLVLAPVVQATITPVDTLDATPRGTGGFGSTGTQ